jgi:chaperonin cofactor prefoldin
MSMRMNPSRVRGFARVVVLASVVVVPQASRAEEAAAATPAADQSLIEYQLRANEDPSKVARMFHVGLDELLALNRIADPRRLTVGTVLKIPDPHESLVKQLTAEKQGLETQLASAQVNVTALKTQADQLQSELTDQRDINEEFRSEQALYHTWRIAVFVAGGMAVVLALGLLLAWGKARDAEQHADVLKREAEVMRAAADKHRQLSAQFELKYQSLFHQVGMPAPAQARAQALRAAYDDDRARLDAIVAEAERQIKGALEALSPKRQTRVAEGRVAPLAAARKSG